MEFMDRSIFFAILATIVCFSSISVVCSSLMLRLYQPPRPISSKEAAQERRLERLNQAASPAAAMPEVEV